MSTRLLEDAWYVLRDTVEIWCCCCCNPGPGHRGDWEHKRFTGDSSTAPQRSTGGGGGGGDDVFVLSQCGVGGGVVNPMFESSSTVVRTKSKTKLKLKWQFKYFQNDSSSHSNYESSTDPPPPPPPEDKFTTRESCSSTTRGESGYGHSIEEGSLNTQYLFTVTESHSKLTYKIIVDDQRKRWVVFRRQLEFITFQEALKKENKIIGPKLPSNERASIQDLNTFLQNVANHGALMQLQSAREFFILDRTRTSSSSDLVEQNDSKERKSSKRRNNNKSSPPSPPPPPLPLIHPPRIASSDTNGISISKLSLGCEEKKMSPKDFEFISLIGKGSFGKVIMARKIDDNKIYAVKMLTKRMILKRNETAHVMSERSVLTRVLKHPYVVQLHFAFTTPSKIYFVLDYVNGGELFYHLQNERTFSESRTRFYAAEICCALTYMHLMGIIYRDLKPENLLLDREGHVVLTDFGLCKEGLEDASARTATFCGTPEYLAPEIILKLPYTRSIDWWTFGAVLYEMLYGLPPFYSKDTTAMYHAIIKRPLKLRSTTSPPARDLLIQLLQKMPSRRLGSGPNDGCEVQAHDFFKSIDWDRIERREVKPQFVPKVRSDDDTSNIDPMFTREAIAASSASSPNLRPTNDTDAFRGFSYVEPKLLELSQNLT